MTGDPPAVRADPARWLMLALFCASSAVNSMQTYTFAPISAATADFFSVGLGGVYALGAVFLALFVPGAALTGYVAARRGLRPPRRRRSGRRRRPRSGERRAPPGTRRK